MWHTVLLSERACGRWISNTADSILNWCQNAGRAKVHVTHCRAAVVCPPRRCAPPAQVPSGCERSPIPARSRAWSNRAGIAWLSCTAADVGSHVSGTPRGVMVTCTRNPNNVAWRVIMGFGPADTHVCRERDGGTVAQTSALVRIDQPTSRNGSARAGSDRSASQEHCGARECPGAGRCGNRLG